MSQTLQVVFPYQWGSLTLVAPPCVSLDGAVEPLKPEVLFVPPSVEGWAELRSRVLQIMASLPPVVSANLSLRGPAPVEAEDPMDVVRQGLVLLGWSHEDLARQLDVTSNTVWRWFSGRTPLPNWVTAYLTMALQARPR